MKHHYLHSFAQNNICWTYCQYHSVASDEISVHCCLPLAIFFLNLLIQVLVDLFLLCTFLNSCYAFIINSCFCFSSFQIIFVCSWVNTSLKDSQLISLSLDFYNAISMYLHSAQICIHLPLPLPALQIRAGHHSITANLWLLTAHIYYVMILWPVAFSRSLFIIVVIIS